MRIWLFLAALCGALAVLLGAFGAHALSDRLPPHARAIFDTGARYQMAHALAMGLAGLAMQGPARNRARAAAIAFLTGIVLFSGSLYLMALTGMTAPAPLTPLGGLAFLAGWGLLAGAALKLPQR